MVHSGYHPLKHRPLRIMLGWYTVDIILLRSSSEDNAWMVHIMDIILLSIVL